MLNYPYPLTATTFGGKKLGQVAKLGGKMKLTDKAIKNAKPKEKAYKLFDGGGLYIEITPQGSKLWRQKYHFLGKEKRISLDSVVTRY
jgi:hypothetical protein